MKELSLRLITFICLLVLSAAANAQNTAKRTVIVISVDGLGQKLLDASDAPNIKNFIAQSDKAPRAISTDPPLTVPNHVSMLTGVHAKTHQQTVNHMGRALKALTARSLFDLAKLNGKQSVGVFGKLKLQYIFDVDNVEIVRHSRFRWLEDIWGIFPRVVENAAVRALHARDNAQNPPALIVLHYATVDRFGHWFKWESALQKWAVRSVDASLGRLFEEIKSTLEPGSYAIILTADHGGHGGAHGRINKDGEYADFESDFVVPWVVHGAKLQTGIKEMSVVDTAPSAAALLGLQVPSEWNWEGRSVIEMSETQTEAEGKK